MRSSGRGERAPSGRPGGPPEKGTREGRPRGAPGLAARGGAAHCRPAQGRAPPRQARARERRDEASETMGRGSAPQGAPAPPTRPLTPPLPPTSCRIRTPPGRCRPGAAGPRSRRSVGWTGVVVVRGPRPARPARAAAADPAAHCRAPTAARLLDSLRLVLQQLALDKVRHLDRGGRGRVALAGLVGWPAHHSHPQRGGAGGGAPAGAPPPPRGPPPPGPPAGPPSAPPSAPPNPPPPRTCTSPAASATPCRASSL